jgi:hypothetical protein
MGVAIADIRDGITVQKANRIIATFVTSLAQRVAGGCVLTAKPFNG